MIIKLKPNITLIEEKKFRLFLVGLKIEVIPVKRTDGNLLVVIGRFGELAKRQVSENKLVDKIIEVDRSYKLASKQFKPVPSEIRINGKAKIGGKDIIVMAGPCSVETKAQITQIASEVKKSGCQVLRGGAYKPRTAPYDFQGLGKIGLHFLKEAGRKHDLPVITEILDIRDIELVEKYTDIYQVGTRNMQNYPLLRELGRITRKPVLLKRGMWATYKELLLAAEYILAGGNPNVILCERGIRTHVPETRFTLDLNAVAYLKHETHLPVVVDPSHGTGRANLVKPLSRAAIAAGADGLLIEAHTNPVKSISDHDQAISLPELAKLVHEVKKIAQAVGRN